MTQNGPKILFLDIETSPNKVFVWGLFNQYVSLDKIIDASSTLCWAAKWKGSSEILFASVHSDGPKTMLKKVHALLDAADIVVHYNGKSFDIPTLNKEFLLHGMPPPSPVKQIDLLQTARRTFKFLSNKLDYVTKALGLGAKVRHKGMDLWVECMAGDEKAWAKMERYNKQDVRLLERLYMRLRPWIKNHPNYGLYVNDAGLNPVCPTCGTKHLTKRGYARTRVGVFHRYQCKTGCWSRGTKNLLKKDDKTNLQREANA